MARPVRRRPRTSLRMKVAMAGLAGVAAAWLLPRGGGTPAPTPSVTPSDRPGVTAVQITLPSIPNGVSFRLIDGVRVFFVRAGDELVAFQGLATTEAGGTVWWCPRNDWFEGASGPYYSARGVVLRSSAPRNLDGIHIQAAGESVTVFPHSVVRGRAAPPGPAGPAPPPPCPASERVG